MSILFMDGFDHYGVGSGVGTDVKTVMLEGAYAELEGTVFPIIPDFGARTGERVLAMPNSGGLSYLRRVLAASQTTLFQGFAVYLDQLPSVDGFVRLMQWRDGSNNTLYTLRVSTTGALEIVAGDDGSQVAITSGPVISAATWTHIEAKIVINATTGEFRVRVNESQVIAVTGANTGTTPIAQVVSYNQNTNSNCKVYLDDWICYNGSGSYNTDFLGDVKIATLLPDADTADDGWTPRPRQRFGTGILTLDGSQAIYCADDADFEMGSGDFTLEGQFRFRTGLPASDYDTLFGKWDEDNDLRSYQLRLGAPGANNGELEFRISTDGAAGTVSTLISVPFEPQPGHYYHIAIARASSVLYLFIDGVLMNVGVADANTYFDGGARFVVGAELTGTSQVSGTQFDGHVDEVRVTKGVGRYTDDFAPPTAAFGRNVGADTDYNSVSLLLGFNDEDYNDDEGPDGRTVFGSGSPVASNPDDGDASYKMVNKLTVDDVTFLEAALLQATAVLEITVNPTDTETVTVGSQTYTFDASFSDTADHVLIGATINDTIDNLAAAINGDAGEGTVYGTGTTTNADASALNLGTSQMRCTAKTAGAGGNSLASTETLANGEFTNGTTFTGGQDIPDHTELALEDLPAEATSLFGIEIFTRQRKLTAGTCQTQISLVTASDNAANGADRPIAQSFAAYSDVFEEDPDTTAAFVVSSLAGAKVRIDRTA